ncbi:hypothetical protein [Undibacterium curvum]
MINRYNAGYHQVGYLIDLRSFHTIFQRYPTLLHQAHKPSYKDDLTKYGEFTARDFKDACWALLHQGVEVCAASPNPIFQALAVLHRKFGKRRLLTLVDKTSETHPLVRYLPELRLSSENLLPKLSVRLQHRITYVKLAPSIKNAVWKCSHQIHTYLMSYRNESMDFISLNMRNWLYCSHRL